MVDAGPIIVPLSPVPLVRFGPVGEGSQVVPNVPIDKVRRQGWWELPYEKRRIRMIGRVATGSVMTCPIPADPACGTRRFLRG
jgi:hypothetical protein